MNGFNPGAYIGAYREVLSEARKRYDIATEAWCREVDAGGIEKLSPMIPADSDEIAKGSKSKATTPSGVTVMAVWRLCKAELDAAAKNHQEAVADLSARNADTRLPPERDDDVFGGEVPAP